VIAVLSYRTPSDNPATFDFRSVATATSFAALTYIGFDGVTTLAEEVENPRRNADAIVPWLGSCPALKLG
jgi:putrescine importer